MTPGALDYLADCFDSRAPGLAVVLRNWAQVVAHDLLAVARESLDALCRAQILAGFVPEDADHRDAIEVLEAVFLSVARAVFARDARGGSMQHEKLTRLAGVAHIAATSVLPSHQVETLQTLQHHLEGEPGEDAATARKLVQMARELYAAHYEFETRALCTAIAAVLERPGLKAENAQLRNDPTLDTADDAPAKPPCPHCGTAPIHPSEVCDAR